MESSRPSTSPSAGRADAAPALRRHDASLYIVASGLGGLGLGIALFYLNFLYRALGFAPPLNTAECPPAGGYIARRAGPMWLLEEATSRRTIPCPHQPAATRHEPFA